MTDLGSRALTTAVVSAVWLGLLVFDDRWSVLSFVVYAFCFTVAPMRPRVGIGFAAAVSVLWAVVFAVTGQPGWTVGIPFVALLAGTALSFTMHTMRRLNDEQADLITQLRATREDLAASERTKGALEERARVAGEIHDTLAQGFTSIVLLTRALRRSGTTDHQVDAIEDVAQHNLDAARRLVRDDQPVELESASLPVALQRHASGAVTAPTQFAFRVNGDARPLPGRHEVVMLRAMQEALANIRTHADASAVEVTLSYLDGAVVLDVRDDGIGFRPGGVTDRGALTGGQGLEVLGSRARSLGGELSVETAPGEGTVISVQLPDPVA